MGDQQRSLQWYLDRCGNCTASKFKDVLPNKGKYSKTREDYMTHVVTEQLTKTPLPGITAAALQWGTDMEPIAITAYEIQTSNVVSGANFVKHKELNAGCSLDGFVGLDGSIEAKCPKNSTNHIKTLMFGIPKEHIPQIQGGMWINNHDWCDFISYDPRMPEHLRLYIERIYKDDQYILFLKNEVEFFLAETEELFKKVSKL